MHQNVAPDILSPFNVQEFSFRLTFSEKVCYFRLYDRKRLLVKPPIITPYSREQMISLLPAAVLHYIILSQKDNTMQVLCWYFQCTSVYVCVIVLFIVAQINKKKFELTK